VILVFALALALSSCGGPRSRSAPAADAPAVAHIHELAVNPRDGSLLLATHYGVFRIARGDSRLRRIGATRHDTMGLAAPGPDRFLASGHPGSRNDLPPLLGLVRSDDGGRDWKRVALLGKADFHVLRATDRTIYGVNATDGRLLVSHNRGSRWSRRVTPAPLVDLVQRPRKPNKILASAKMMLFGSTDGGRSWRAASLEHAGLLAWPAERALFLLDSRGTVRRSADAGRSWQTVGRIGGAPTAFTAHGSNLYAALRDNTIRVSSNGGKSWTVRARAEAPAGMRDRRRQLQTPSRQGNLGARRGEGER
jgi:hypothetical protein